MARELSQEALLDFLCQAGGRVTNAALLSHFKSFLRDPAAPPDLREHRRELFKGFVNSVAAVRQDSDGTKCVVLRRRYRDLVGEGPGPGAPPGLRRRGARPDSETARDQLGTPSPETPHLQRHRPAPPAQERPGPVTAGTPHSQRHHTAPPARDRPEPVTLGIPQPQTPRPKTPHLQHHHPTPPAQERLRPVTSGTPHSQRHHPAPPARDRLEPVTLGIPQPGTSRPKTPHLQCHHPVSSAGDRPEPVTLGFPENPRLQHHHPAPPVWDGLELGAPGTPHLQRYHPVPPVRDRPEPVTLGTASPETPHLPCDCPGPPPRDRPESVTLRNPQPETPCTENPHLQQHHHVPPALDGPEPGTPGTPRLQRHHLMPPESEGPEARILGTPQLQRYHPAPPVWDRREPVTLGIPQLKTPLPESPQLLHHHPAPPVQDGPEPVTLGTPSPKTAHLPCDRPAPPSRHKPEPVTSGATDTEASPLQRQYPTSLSRDKPEPEPPSAPHAKSVRLQLPCTEECVARKRQRPEPRDRGPVRAWSVLPDDFLQLSSEPASFVREAPPPAPALSSSVLPADGAGPRLGTPATTVFRSIRCQLSLQGLDDFVDQQSHGSEESSSGPEESPGGSEEGLRAAPGVLGSGKSGRPARGLPGSRKEGTAALGPQDLRGGGQRSGQVPEGLGEPLPWPALKPRRSFRRSPRAGSTALSSSDEEGLGEDLLKRTRRPPRPRKPSRAGTVSGPRVDVALTLTPAGTEAAAAEPVRPHSWQGPSGEGPTASAPRRASEHRSSLVPLEAREHEWIVRLASGSWTQVRALFGEDPQLALHRDFLTGYTALHWTAKHGNLSVLQDLVWGTRQAGIALDINVRSSCGYTPLHLAAIHGHQAVIKLLVQRLASRVNVRDSSGKKPWQYLGSDTSGEIWQLLGAPRGKPIFPVHALVQNSSPSKKTKNREVLRNVTRKTSLAALLKNQHNKWKLTNHHHHEKFPSPREREEYSD